MVCNKDCKYFYIKSQIENPHFSTSVPTSTPANTHTLYLSHCFLLKDRVKENLLNSLMNSLSDMPSIKIRLQQLISLYITDHLELL